MLLIVDDEFQHHIPTDEMQTLWRSLCETRTRLSNTSIILPVSEFHKNRILDQGNRERVFYSFGDIFCVGAILCSEAELTADVLKELVSTRRIHRVDMTLGQNGIVVQWKKAEPRLGTPPGPRASQDGDKNNSEPQIAGCSVQDLPSEPTSADGPSGQRAHAIVGSESLRHPGGHAAMHSLTNGNAARADDAVRQLLCVDGDGLPKV